MFLSEGCGENLKEKEVRHVKFTTCSKGGIWSDCRSLVNMEGEQSMLWREREIGLSSSFASVL